MYLMNMFEELLWLLELFEINFLNIFTIYHYHHCQRHKHTIAYHNYRHHHHQRVYCTVMDRWYYQWRNVSQRFLLPGVRYVPVQTGRRSFPLHEIRDGRPQSGVPLHIRYVSLMSVLQMTVRSWTGGVPVPMCVKLIRKNKDGSKGCRTCM